MCWERISDEETLTYFVVSVRLCLITTIKKILITKLNLKIIIINLMRALPCCYKVSRLKIEK